MINVNARDDMVMMKNMCTKIQQTKNNSWVDADNGEVVTEQGGNSEAENILFIGKTSLGPSITNNYVSKIFAREWNDKV